jgi:antitoxin VapB
MSMNIKDQETHDMARELAKLTGQSLNEAVKIALQNELKRAKVTQVKKVRPSAERLDEIALRCAALPDLDTRTPEEIIGYNEHGLPV